MLSRAPVIQPCLKAGTAAGWRGPAAEMPGADTGSAKDKLALALLRAEYARLLAAARATMAAARAGAADPLVYVEAELARHGGLPPRGASVPAVLADARTAMMLAAGPHGPVMAE